MGRVLPFRRDRVHIRVHKVLSAAFLLSSPAVVSAEVIHVIPPLVAVTALAGISLLHRENPRLAGIEIRFHNHLGGESETASTYPF